MSQALMFAGLPDVDFVRPRSKENDDLFRELANVLEKYGALDRFGVTLLHTHFEIQEGEVLLETTDHKTREQVIKPVRVKDIESLQALETSWRLGKGGETLMACKCLKTPDGNQHQGHYST